MLFVISTNAHLEEAEGFTASHIKNKLGVRGSATGDLHFDNVKVSTIGQFTHHHFNSRKL